MARFATTEFTKMRFAKAKVALFTVVRFNVVIGKSISLLKSILAMTKCREE